MHFPVFSSANSSFPCICELLQGVILTYSVPFTVREAKGMNKALVVKLHTNLEEEKYVNIAAQILSVGTKTT